MYGLIGSFRAQPGQGAALVAEMSAGGYDIAGLISYIVAQDAGDPDLLWITEVWTDAAAHKASLQLEFVQASIKRAMPLIAEFGQHIVTVPVAGKGL